MKISPETPQGSVVLHEKHGPGIVKCNYTIEQQGKDYMPFLPHRLIAIQFENRDSFVYVRPDEEYLKVIPATVNDVAPA